MREEPAIDREALAGDVPRLIRPEVNDEACDIFADAEPRHEVVAHDHRAVLLGEMTGLDQAGELSLIHI